MNFTNWLVEEENLGLLSDEIGIDIKLIRTEADVGKFNVDVLAIVENTDEKVVIENQLEISDHDHLGKIITYASGYEANYIIWIVKDIRDEHKRAIDWLNEHSDDKIHFFIIKIELWQIDNSEYAPKFQIISKPNDWAKEIKSSVNKYSETNLLQLEFWTRFKEFCEKKETILKLRKPQPQMWYEIKYGDSKSHISLTVSTQKKVIGCEIYIPDSMDHYHELLKFKEELENELNEKLEWMEIKGKKSSRI
ncbi:MAG: DUF4268 domain-containing protein, partial [Candidatus Hodarchaeales archaeon]